MCDLVWTLYFTKATEWTKNNSTRWQSWIYQSINWIREAHINYNNWRLPKTTNEVDWTRRPDGNWIAAPRMCDHFQIKVFSHTHTHTHAESELVCRTLIIQAGAGLMHTVRLSLRIAGTKRFLSQSERWLTVARINFIRRSSMNSMNQTAHIVWGHLDMALTLGTRWRMNWNPKRKGDRMPAGSLFIWMTELDECMHTHTQWYLV